MRRRYPFYNNSSKIEFKFSIDTTLISTGSSNSNQFTLPLINSESLDFDIDWGDSNIDNITLYNQSEVTHTYSISGIYTITIKPNIDRGLNGWQFLNNGDKLKMQEIFSWSGLTINESNCFDGCQNMTSTADNSPFAIDIMNRVFLNCDNLESGYENFDVSNVFDFDYCFLNSNIDPDISLWDMSSAERIRGILYNTNCSADLSNWDLSNVDDMREAFINTNLFFDTTNWNASPSLMRNCFQGCTSIGASDLSGIDVSNVLNFSYTFTGCNNFLGIGLNTWDVSNATNMTGMFYDADNIDITNASNWDVSNVQVMTSMFERCNGFTGIGVLENWITTSLTTITNMFRECTAFNCDIGNWNVSNVTDMTGLFHLSNAPFNYSLNNWNVSNVTSFNRAFRSLNQYNQPMSNWNTSNIGSFFEAFLGCSSLNQDLSNFDFSNLTSLSGFGSGWNLSQANIDLLLIQLSATATVTGITADIDGNFTLGGAAETAYNDLTITKGWTINGLTGI